MSVVANVVTPSGSWVAFDGRVTRDDGSISSEDEIKAKMVNGSVCVGYTGVLEVARHMVREITSEKNAASTARLASDEVARLVCALYRITKRPDDTYAQFLITGRNSDGKFATYTVNMTGELTEYISKDEFRPVYVSLKNKDVGCDLKEFLSAAILEYGCDGTAFEHGLTGFIKEVSKHDITVNGNVRIIRLS